MTRPPTLHPNPRRMLSWGRARPRCTPGPPAAMGRSGHGTVGVGADGAALSEGDLGVGAVRGVLADHLIAEDVAAVADADLAGFWFPHILVVVCQSILHAAPSLDWERRGRAGGA